MSEYLKQAIEQARAQTTLARTPGGKGSAAPSMSGTDELPPPDGFFPREPRSFEEAGLDSAFVEELLLKFLLTRRDLIGRAIARDLALPSEPTQLLLRDMMHRKLVLHRGATHTGDFQYDLSDAGRAEARSLQQISRYAGEAPVPIEQYVESVKLQTISHETPTPADLARALADLEVSPEMQRRLGPALAACKGLFLYGEPGNGKTSIASRINHVYGHGIYIPRALLIGGTVVKLYDEGIHVADPDPLDARRRLDRRWVRCRRPCVIAGGELTLDSLEIQWDPLMGICEAPLQLKANCGTLVLDDFGRQRVDPRDLLNRWIVPMEHRVDILRMPDGRKVTVPFDSMLVFSTNVDPTELVDEAFLRRIPYKFEVTDPDAATFTRLLTDQARKAGLMVQPGAAEALLAEYRRAERPMRYCHPRDLVQQVVYQKSFRQEEFVLDADSLTEATKTYFG